MIKLKLASTAMTLACSLVFSVASQTAFAADKPGEGITIRPAEGTQIEEKFQHIILYKALEELGYKIAEPSETEYQTIHLALGQGDADFTAVNWKPLHDAFYKESGGDEKLARLGTYVTGSLQGYLVDKASYDAGVKNIGDLKDPEVAKRFDSDNDGKADLAGCIPGWGCERNIEHHLTEYKLRDTIEHNQGAYAVMMADTIARHKTGKPILYFTWTPYWVSGVLVPGKDVEWLAVPYSSSPDGVKEETTYEGKDLGFAVNTIHIAANKAFIEKNPAAKAVFEVAKLDINDISAENGLIKDGEDKDKDIERHAADWIKKNQAMFDSWVKAGRDAK